MTAELLELGDWLATQGVTHVAMESIGVYWKPPWNLRQVTQLASRTTPSFIWPRSG